MKPRPNLTSQISNKRLLLLTSVVSMFSVHAFFSKKNSPKQLDVTMAEAEKHIAKADENARASAELDKKVLKTLKEADRVLEEARTSRISRGFRRN